MGENELIRFETFQDVLLATVRSDRLDYMIINKLHRRIGTQAASAARFNVILDLGAVSQISSLIFSELVKTLKQLQDQDRRFILVGLDKNVRASFQITRMELLFEIRSTALEALEILAPRPASGSSAIAIGAASGS
jgi:anti-anti-sigma factor